MSNSVINKNKDLNNALEKIDDLVEELLIKNQELESTMDELVKAQSQLILTEKMATLGQLVAGIAHEINTPLGAIKASSESIDFSFKYSLSHLSEILEILDLDTKKLFYELLDFGVKNDTFLSSRDERLLRKKVISYFIKEINEVIPDNVDYLVLLGIHDDEELKKFTPIFNHPESKKIILVAYHIANQQKLNKNIQLSLDKVSKIIRALKTYSYQNAKEIKETIDIVDNVEVVLMLYYNNIKKKIDLTRHFPIEKVYISCYTDQISQIWVNLIQNAIDAMVNGGSLDVYILDLGDNIEIKIQDTGSGIPVEAQKEVFKPFYTTKSKGEGTGLGLDIVSKIVAKHNGTIRFETEIGVGTTFIVNLPKNL